MNWIYKRLILMLALFLFMPQVYFVTDCPMRTGHCEDSLAFGVTYNVLLSSYDSIFKYKHWEYLGVLIPQLLIAFILAYLISHVIIRDKVVRKVKDVSVKVKGHMKKVKKKKVFRNIKKRKK